VIILPCPNVDTLSRPDIVDTFGRANPGYTMPGEFPNTQMVVGEFIWTAEKLQNLNKDHSIYHACPEPPLPPPPPPVSEYQVLLENKTHFWSNDTTWTGTHILLSNPFNTIKYDERNYPPAAPEVVVQQKWEVSTPGDGDNVWIVPLRTVVLDVDSANIRGLIIDEGANLLLSKTHSVSLSAAFVTIRAGTMLVCDWQCTPTSVPDVTMVCSCTAPLPKQHTATINLLGDRFAPRISTQPWMWWPPTEETMQIPPAYRPAVARRIHSAMYNIDNAKTLTVNGELNLWGAAHSHSWVQLREVAQIGDTELTVSAEVDWKVGMQLVVAGTDYYNAGTNRNEIRTIVRTMAAASGTGTTLTLDSPLNYKHHSSVEIYGETDDDDASGISHTMDMRAEIALLDRNIIIQGADQDSEWAGTATSLGDAYEWPSDLENRGMDGRYFYEPTSQFGFGGRLAVFTLEEEILTQYGSYVKDFVGRARVTNVRFTRMGRSEFMSENELLSTNKINIKLQNSPTQYGSFPAVEFGQNGKGGPRSFITNSSILAPFGEGIVKTGCAASYLVFSLSAGIDRGGTGKQDEPKVRSKWCADSGLSVMANTVVGSKGSSFKLEMPCDPDRRRLTGTAEGSAGCTYRGVPNGIGRGEALSIFEGNLAIGMIAGAPRKWWSYKNHPEWRLSTHVDAAYDFSSPHGVLVKNNVAAGGAGGGGAQGSYSVGFLTGAHKKCRGGTLAEGWFLTNRVHSMKYGVVVSPTSSCIRLDGISIYKAKVGIHVLPDNPIVGPRASMVLVRVQLADCVLGVSYFLVGGDTRKHVREDTWTTIQDSLFIGRSRENYDCSAPSVTGMLPVVFASKQKLTFSDSKRLPAVTGGVLVQRVWLANWRNGVCSGDDIFFRTATTPLEAYTHVSHRDTIPPHFFVSMEKEQVELEQLFDLHDTTTATVGPRTWCGSQDCDGGRQRLLYDVDGSLVGGSGSSVMSLPDIPFSAQAIGAIPPFSMLLMSTVV
jgi:hypothetical protein